MAVVELVNVLRTWWKSLYSSNFIRYPFLASWLMNVATDVTAIEELTLYCRWVESGKPEEHFIEILYFKKANLKVSILH